MMYIGGIYRKRREVLQWLQNKNSDGVCLIIEGNWNLLTELTIQQRNALANSKLQDLKSFLLASGFGSKLRLVVKTKT